MPIKQIPDPELLLMPPPDGMREGDSLFGPPPRQPVIESFEEMQDQLLALQPQPEAMPTYIQYLLSMASVPRSLTAGQTLEWTNACKASAQFTCAVAQVSDCSQCMELRLQFATGRKVRMAERLHQPCRSYERYCQLHRQLLQQPAAALKTGKLATQCFRAKIGNQTTYGLCETT